MDAIRGFFANGWCFAFSSAHSLVPGVSSLAPVGLNDSLAPLELGLTCHKGMPTPGIYGWVSKQTDLNKINPSKQLVQLILNTCVLLVSPREHIVCRLMHLKKEKEQGKKK